jgi:hypothetical protein
MPRSGRAAKAQCQGLVLQQPKASLGEYRRQVIPDYTDLQKFGDV